MLRQLCIADGRLVEAPKGQGNISIYILPDDSEKKYLIDELKIDEHTLHSSLDPDEISRLEFEPEHIAMIFKRPKRYQAADNFLFKVSSIGVFIFKDKLIIVMAEDAPILEGKLFTKIHSIQDISLKLIQRSILHFVEHLRGIDTISGELEQHIYTSMENKPLANLLTLEKSLVYYLSAINSNGILIEKLKNNAQKIGLSQENIELLDDIMIENTQCRGQAEIYSQVLSSLMDARVSIVSNNLNIRIKALTLITIAIMLPTLIVSIFSMNVGIPLAGHPYAFVMITALAATSSLTVGILWWNRKW
jgi:magnesium transporter